MATSANIPADYPWMKPEDPQVQPLPGFTRSPGVGAVTPPSGPGFDSTSSALKGLTGLLSHPGATGAAATPGQVTMPDVSGAQATTFARAKDQTALNSRAALTAMQNEMGGANLLGSGAEAAATRDIIAKGAGGLNEVTREQAIQDATLGNNRAIADYQGRITQRGQDINAAQQAAARQQSALQGLLQAIDSRGIMY